jgi:hypothetical protein
VYHGPSLELVRNETFAHERKNSIYSKDSCEFNYFNLLGDHCYYATHPEEKDYRPQRPIAPILKAISPSATDSRD